MRAKVGTLRSGIASHDPSTLGAIRKDAEQLRAQAEKLGYDAIVKQLDSIIRIATAPPSNINPSLPPVQKLVPLPED